MLSSCVPFWDDRIRGYARDTRWWGTDQLDTDGSVTLPFTCCAIVAVVVVVAVVDIYAHMYDMST